MKQKLAIVMALIAVAITGTIIFQLYWTFNAYRFNKAKFDYNIDTAMLRAMNDCKKDYFDSIRHVMVKRLSPPEMQIQMDTISEADSLNEPIKVSFNNQSMFRFEPYQFKRSVIDYYRRKIGHPATNAELFTEMSFYQPNLLHGLTMLLGTYDLTHGNGLLLNTKRASNSSCFKLSSHLRNGIYALPPRTKAADSLKLTHYFEKELNKLKIYESFQLIITDKLDVPILATDRYSETLQYPYKYHGFVFLDIVGPVYYMKAVFNYPQYGILKSMWLSLLCSGLLLLFTLFCFFYIIRTIRQQKKISELKDDFINNITHELKTPLATMTVAIEGLQNFNALKDPDKTQRYLQTSRDQINHLNKLVDKVLNAATYEKQGVKLHKEDINVDTLIQEVIASEEVRSGKKVHFEYLNQGIEIIKADKVHFRNVLANLVDNAIKYATEPVWVTITCRIEKSNAVISIKDDGIGIPEKYLHQIFDKFYRVPTGNLHQVKGTGLGLSYVKTVAEAHGGNVTVKSLDGVGSEFIVSIPLA
ncbi:HAMP domain-containing histidine kinase [Mucilaginibacter robiniae]|uniref:histidine kinase n=1 Tax=Mucilaginibacter robiniae TaxID=2728022 RepID=A0A7L5DZA6_9SPHI|nr:HAMP domain-containing sensor histidine kinase [Mucilaginibacter robiniae]QJD96442.1 HAMP domain-containing histidine kinase [Mucilaginibacter robiniae]